MPNHKLNKKQANQTVALQDFDQIYEKKLAESVAVVSKILNGKHGHIAQHRELHGTA